MTTVVEQRVERKELVALADTTLSSGSGFIFSGYYRETPSYFYYQRIGDGYFQGNISADGVAIVEDAPVNTAWIQGEYSVRISPDSNLRYKHWVILPTKEEIIGEKAISIHVPSGTVVRKFNLDLEK